MKSEECYCLCGKEDIIGVEKGHLNMKQGSFKIKKMEYIRKLLLMKTVIRRNLKISSYTLRT